jgi:hypothetical protein
MPQVMCVVGHSGSRRAPAARHAPLAFSMISDDFGYCIFFHAEGYL